MSKKEAEKELTEAEKHPPFTPIANDASKLRIVKQENGVEVDITPSEKVEEPDPGPSGAPAEPKPKK